jgi:hypothetical protein
MSIVGKGFKLMGCLIKLLFGLLIFAVCGFLLWRIFSSSTPDSLTDISVNDAIYEAYEADGELGAFRQEQGTITRGARSPGYFSITHTVFIPEANQIQVVLRYNNSTITATAEDYGLEETPARSDNIYDVTLLFAIDITPENKDDNLETDEDSVRFVRVHASDCESGEKNLYNFRRFVFDLETSELDLNYLLDEELLIAVYTDVYYIGDLDYEETPYGTLCLYDYLEKNIEIKPKKTLFERFSDEE